MILTVFEDPAPLEAYIYAGVDSLLLVPNPNWNGETIISVYVNDEEFTEMTSFTFTVNPVDDEPYVDGNMPDLYFYLHSCNLEFKINLATLETIKGDSFCKCVFK